MWRIRPTIPSSEVEAVVLENVSETKTVVSVLSPPFVHSKGCCKVVERFWKSAEGRGRFLINDRARILNVVKTPVEDSEIPALISTIRMDCSFL